MIKEAEGKAEAILKVQQATADGIRFIKEAGADESVLTLKESRSVWKSSRRKGNEDYYSI